LWANEIPDDELREETEAILSYKSINGDPWAVWAKWFRSFHDGAPPPDEIIERLLTEGKFSSPENAATRLQAIEADYLRQRTQVLEDTSQAGDELARYDVFFPKLILSHAPVAPRLVETADAERLTLDLDARKTPDHVEFALKNIQAALEHALSNSARNGFSTKAEEAGLLSFALDKLPKEPRYLVEPLHQAHLDLERKLENGEYPKDAALLFLSTQCKAHVINFIEIDVEAKAHLESYAKLPEVEPLSRDALKKLKEAPERLEPALEDSARNVIEEIADSLEVGQKPGKFEIAFVGQWMAQIWLWLEKAKKQSSLAAWIWELLDNIF
jgi:hypothetical protein